MEIKLQKRDHKALLSTKGQIVSMVTWGRSSGEENITGVKTEMFDTQTQARVLLRKLSRIMQANGYKLTAK